MLLLRKCLPARHKRSSKYVCVCVCVCIYIYIYIVGRDSSVGIETRYGLNGPEIESRWRRDFPHLSRPAWSPPSLLYNGYRVFPGVKAVGAWRCPPTPSSAEVKERVQLYLYSPSGLSWPVLGWTLSLLVIIIRIIITIHDNRSWMLHRTGCQCCWPTLRPERPSERSCILRS